MYYNRGNYEKYMSKNPLKRRMVERFNIKIVALIKNAVKNLKLQTGKVSFLDAGCGEGFIDSIIYNNINDISLKGLEYTEEALNIARKMNPQAEYIQGDIYNMPFEDNSADIVICTEVLEHLEKPEQAVRELLRVSRRYILLTVPNEPWFCMGNLIALKNVSRLGNPIDHINHWTYGGFKKFVNSQFSGKVEFDRSFPWSIAILCLEKNEDEKI